MTAWQWTALVAASWLSLALAILALVSLALRRAEYADPVDDAIDEAAEITADLADEVEAWLRMRHDLTRPRQTDPEAPDA